MLKKDILNSYFFPKRDEQNLTNRLVSCWPTSQLVDHPDQSLVNTIERWKGMGWFLCQRLFFFFYIYSIFKLTWEKERGGERKRALVNWQGPRQWVFRENFDLLQDDSDLMVSSPHSITTTHRSRETDGCGNSLLWSVVSVFFFVFFWGMATVKLISLRFPLAFLL